jgi:hypothetical protein
MRTIVAVALLAAATCCQSQPPSRSNPAEAFARLAPCVDSADTGCLFDELDRDSRWSLSSIHRTLNTIGEIVDRSYPADRRDPIAVYGTWAQAAGSKNAHEAFSAFCSRHDCLRTLAQGLGAVTETSALTETTATVTTTRGVSFQMARADGEWGLATYRDELIKEKIRLGDNLSQVQQNAADFDEQRLATGGK